MNVERTSRADGEDNRAMLNWGKRSKTRQLFFARSRAEKTFVWLNVAEYG